jgi:coproporphyrinogen III oxidase
MYSGYDHHPEVGSEEEKLVKVLENPMNWNLD